MIAPSTGGEPILRRGKRDIRILVASDEVTISRVAHSLRNDRDSPARWLTIHARDGGFAVFMRGIHDGLEVDWDISAEPPGGGLPASDAIVRS